MKNHNSAMENASTMDEALEAGIAMKVMQPISEAEAHNIMPIHIDVRPKRWQETLLPRLQIHKRTREEEKVQDRNPKQGREIYIR